MNVIRYRDINFKELEELKNIQANNSKLYVDKEQRKNIYKIFRGNIQKTYDEKGKKIELFSNLNDADFLMQTEYIIKRLNKTKGIIAKYINGLTLYEVRNQKSLLKFINILIDVSKKLKKFHGLEGNPVIGDLNFGNILIDKNLNSYFIDIDSYGIYDLIPDTVSQSLYNYCMYNNYSICKNQYTDRLSFMIEVIGLIFYKDISKISVNTFDQYKEQYKFLEDIREVFLELKMSHAYMPDVPYFHEVIQDIDNKYSLIKNNRKML